MMRIGIIGCGKIADAHAEQIQKIPHAEIVAVCDKEELMAKQLYERHHVGNYYSDVKQMLKTAQPEVVHITTPPQSHFELAKLCIDSGCHVYMEKPFTVTTEEATQLIDYASVKNVKMTVGHDYQFTHAKRRMRKLINEGYLGGPPVHMESYHCYELGSESYAKALLGDKKHWVRMLPGTLMHNNISHGISSIAEYLTEENPKVIAYGFSSPFLRGMNETDITDEARVIISEKDSTSAYFTFSTQMRPTLHQFRVYGHKNALIVDHDQQTCIKVNGEKYISYLEKFVAPVIIAKQYVISSLYNMSLFLKNDFHMKAGMKCLIESFYRSIEENAPLPISYKEILTTSRIMDSIFTQINPSHHK